MADTHDRHYMPDGQTDADDSERENDGLKQKARVFPEV